MSRIWFHGEALIDFVPQNDAAGPAYLSRPGGSPFNAAKAAALAGGQAAFIGAISRDFFGDMLRADLAGAGVDTAHAEHRDEATPLAFVKLEAGEARYAFYTAATAMVAADPRPAAALMAPGDILGLGSIALIERPAAEHAADMALAAAGAGVTLALDPNARPVMTRDPADWRGRMARLLSAATIVRLSREDLAAIDADARPGEFAAHALAGGAALVVVTDGAEGATAFTPRARHHEPAPAVAVADTVGAGDVLTGSLLARLAEGKRGAADSIAAMGKEDLAGLLRFAVKAAAINCTRTGCVPPDRAEIEAERAAR